VANAASTFQVDPFQIYTVTSAIGGTGTLNKTGSGTMMLNGANTYSGGTKINAGTLKLGASSALPNSAVTVSGIGAGTIATLDLNGFNDTIASLALGGSTTTSGAAVTTGSGTLTLGGNVTYDAANNPLGATISGKLSLGLATRTFTVGDSTSAAADLTVSAVISGIGGLIKSGTGTLVLSGTNTYTGNSTINAGTVVVNSDASLGAATGTLALNAGTLEVSTGFSTLRLIALGDAASTFQIDASQTYTVNGVISGTGALNKTGTGTMILGGVNTFSGGTNILAGTLQMSVINQLLNTGAVTLSGGTFDLLAFNQTVGTVILSSGAISGTGVLTGSSFDLRSGSISAVLAGTGGLTKTTAGTVTLSGANLYTGSTTVSAGTLQVNANNALGTVLNGTTVSSGAALKLNNVNYSAAEALTLNGSGISGGGALFNSGTSIFAGAINIATDATISAGGGTLTLTGGISKNGTTLTFSGGGTINIMTNGISGSSSNSDLVIDGTTVVLDTANSYNGPTTVQNSGTLKLGANNVLPSSPQTALTVNTSSVFDMASYSDGVASLAGDSTATVKNSVAGGTSTLTVNPASGVSTTFAGVIAGTNGGAQGDIALLKTGAGTLVLAGANTYTGLTTVSAGTLQISASERLANSGALTVSGGTFDLQTFNETVAAVTLSSGSITGSGSATLTGSSYAVQSGSVSAILGGTAALTKSTSGTVTLSGANTFTGSTTVNAGTLTLAASGSGALGSTSSITVNSGGTVLLGASNQINNSATMTLAGGTFAKGNFSEGSTSTAGVGALTLTATGSRLDFGTGTVGTLTFASFSSGTNTLIIDNWTGTANTIGIDGSTDRLVFNSDQTSNLSDFWFTGYAPGASEFSLGNGYYEITPTVVPEPSTCAGAALALAVLVLHLLRQRNRKKS
jgi:fibronectin-binding autotransporter adhesin